MQEEDSNPRGGLNQSIDDEKDPQHDDNFQEEVKNLKRHDRKMLKGFMRGFGKIIILWLISKKRQHGYEIMTQIHESTPFSSKMPSASMIYPVLHGLEKKGLIIGTWEHHGKRKVKYYEITPEGEESLERIRKIGKRPNNLYKEFMEDMFSLKQNYS